MANIFIDIPEELLIQILSNLDAVSLTRCAITCRFVYNTLRSSSILTYIVQLHLDGLKDVGTLITLSHAELIESILRRRQAWLSLEWTSFTTHHMQHICQAYDLVGGMLVSSGREHLEVVWLPTSDVETRAMHSTLPGISIRDFTMDPTQDVIALLEDRRTTPSLTDPRTFHILIRTISSNTAHPLAQQSSIDFDIIPDDSCTNEIYNTCLQISHTTFVAVLHLCSEWRETRTRVWVWDWTTSDLKMDSFIVVDPLLSSPSFEFGLLDSTFCFATSTSDSGSIQLYKLVQSSVTNTPVIHLATLHFPVITSDTDISRISAHAGPIEAYPLFSTPFMLNDDDRLHVFTVVYSHPGIENDHTLNMFVHQRVFTKYASPRVHLGDPPLDIPWEEWGPPNTRIIYPSCVDPDNWTRYIHGQRAISFASIDYNDDASVEVIDFSLAAVLSAKGVRPMMVPSPYSGTTSGALLPPDTIRASIVPLFEHDVESHLPCVSFKRGLDNTYLAHMIYSDGIVGVNGLHMLADGSNNWYTVVEIFSPMLPEVRSDAEESARASGISEDVADDARGRRVICAAPVE